MTDSYEMLDRYLRNNLSDDDYSEYSEALYELSAPSAMLQIQVETLRQRVAELEESEKSWIERGNYWTDEAAKINAELAALKIDNGLTIAYMSGFRDGKKDAQQQGDPVLYQCTKCGASSAGTQGHTSGEDNGN